MLNSRTRSVGRKKREKGSKKLAGFLRSFRPRECSMKMKEGRRNRNQGTNVAPLAVGFAFVARTMMESGVCERSGMRFSYLLSLIFVRQSHGYRWVDTAPLAGEGAIGGSRCYLVAPTVSISFCWTNEEILSTSFHSSSVRSYSRIPFLRRNAWLMITQRQ